MSDPNCIDFSEKFLFPFVISMARDKVCNIRMNSLWNLKKLMKLMKNNSNINEAKLVMEELKKDTDFEVMNGLADE